MSILPTIWCLYQLVDYVAIGKEHSERNEYERERDTVASWAGNVKTRRSAGRKVSKGAAAPGQEQQLRPSTQGAAAPGQEQQLRTSI